MSVDTYDDTLASIDDAIRTERDPERAMQRVVEVLKRQLPHYTWVGIYLLEGDELVLGPFLGKPSPHTRIPIGSGICGAAARERETIIVDDVNADSRYLACSLETRSEIVVPIMSGARVVGEIDIDSDQPAAFGDADKRLLESVASLLGLVIRSSA
ncbi:MAG TPA: GAF domain-containing protein [Vicinamibacterales bacterium]|nr:GAF domain-containing protein [Vicinamibacterales bacterium]